MLLGIKTADCVPVLVADVKRRVVGAFHAGWRGTVARIVEKGVGEMRRQFGSVPRDLRAAIGPSIRRCCYQVGPEVRAEFESQFPYSGDLFEEVFDANAIHVRYPMLFLTARAPGHSELGPELHLDLVEANRRQLEEAGLRAERHQRCRRMHRVRQDALLLAPRGVRENRTHDGGDRDDKEQLSVAVSVRADPLRAGNCSPQKRSLAWAKNQNSGSETSLRPPVMTN